MWEGFLGPRPCTSTDSVTIHWLLEEEEHFLEGHCLILQCLLKDRSAT